MYFFDPKEESRPHFSCGVSLFTIRSDKGNMKVTFDKSGSRRILIRLPTAVLIEMSYFTPHTDITITN